MVWYNGAVDNFYSRSLAPEVMAGLPEGEARLKFLLRYAILAPSSHNTQPWLFRIRHPEIEILINEERILAASDPIRRQAVISIGCAVANLLLAARAFTLKTHLRYAPYQQRLAVVAVSGQPEPPSAEGRALLQAIVERSNNRSLYRPDPADPQFIRWMGGFSDDHLHIIYADRPEIKQLLSAVVLEAVAACFKDRCFTSELSLWLRPSRAGYQDGLVGNNIGVPYLISFILPWLMKKFDLSRQQVNLHRAMLEQTPVIGIITTRRDDQESWLAVGERYETIAVAAQKQGLATAILAAPIEIGRGHQSLQDILKTPWRPQLFFRLGYPTQHLPPSPRLPLEKILLED